MKLLTILFLTIGFAQISIADTGWDKFQKGVSKIGCNAAKQAEFKRIMDAGGLWKAKRKDVTRWYSSDASLFGGLCEAGGKIFQPDDTLMSPPTRTHYYCGMKVYTCNLFKETPGDDVY